MTLRLRNVQVDVPPEGHDEAVAFWAAALGAERVGVGPCTLLADGGAAVRDRGHPWTIMTDPIGTLLCVVPDRTDA